MASGVGIEFTTTLDAIGITSTRLGMLDYALELLPLELAQLFGWQPLRLLQLELDR